MFDFKFEEPRGASAKVVEPGKDDRGSAVYNIKVDSSAGAKPHPLSELFLKLWDERSRGAFVELHLSDGAVIVPDDLRRTLSAATHGSVRCQGPGWHPHIDGGLLGTRLAGSMSVVSASCPRRCSTDGTAILSLADLAHRLAAIDIGTNSIRLIVAEPLRGGNYRILDEEKESTRLGQCT